MMIAITSVINNTSQKPFCFRQNPNNPQPITNGNLASLLRSNFDSRRPTKVVIHGWNSNANSAANTMIKDALLKNQDCNVIMMDWSNAGGNAHFTTASATVSTNGQSLANFLNWLNNNNAANWNNIHIVGFNLGAHLAGSTGRQTSGRINRITGK
jgi:pancreatic triacylglycerol lipase